MTFSRKSDDRPSAEKSHNTILSSAFVLLFLLAGIYGVLAFLRPLPHVTFSDRIVYPLAAILSVLLLLFYRIRRWTYWLLLSGTAAGIFFFLRTRFSLLLFQIYRIGDDLTGVPSSEVYDITMTAVLLVIALVFLFFLLEIVIRNHSLLYILTTALLLAAPIANIRITFPEVLMIAAFQIAFWGLRAASVPKKRRASQHAGRIAFRSVLVLLLITVPVTAAAWLIVDRNESGLESAVFSIEGNITGTWLNAEGDSTYDKTDGHVSRGNNYKTGKTKLHVTLDEQPTEALYLKGFTGGDYTGSNFEEADEQPVFDDIAKDLNWNAWSRYIPDMVRSMYYAMNFGERFEKRDLTRSVTIRLADADDNLTYLPYYSAGLQDRQIDRKKGYQTYYFESKDVDIDWDARLSEADPGFAGWYGEMRRVYADEVQSLFTKINASMVPRLAELVRQNPQEGLDNITAFILYTLQNNASYTLTPGATPLNEDAVEYFLFENHRGYCQQFAAAATLMFRMYGIPARYVSGYRISPSAFQSENDREWTADATDEDMHAWPEIYTEDRGWIPIEVTPSGDTSSATYPGFSGEGMQAFLSAHGLSLQQGTAGDEDAATAVSPTPAASDSSVPDSSAAVSESEQDSLSVSTTSQETASEPSETSRHSAHMREMLAQVLKVCAIAACIAAAAFALVQRVTHRIRRLTARQWFALMMNWLRLAGFASSSDGQEADFPEKLADFLAQREKPIRNTDSIRQMQEIILRITYSPDDTITPEEASLVRAVCKKIIRNAVSLTAFRKRIGYSVVLLLRLLIFS